MWQRGAMDRWSCFFHLSNLFKCCLNMWRWFEIQKNHFSYWLQEGFMQHFSQKWLINNFKDRSHGIESAQAFWSHLLHDFADNWLSGYYYKSSIVHTQCCEFPDSKQASLSFSTKLSRSEFAYLLNVLILCRFCEDKVPRKCDLSESAVRTSSL